MIVLIQSTIISFILVSQYLNVISSNKVTSKLNTLETVKRVCSPSKHVLRSNSSGITAKCGNTGEIIKPAINSPHGELHCVSWKSTLQEHIQGTLRFNDALDKLFIWEFSCKVILTVV